MKRISLFAVVALCLSAANAFAGTKAFLHVELYQDLYKPTKISSTDAVMALLNTGTVVDIEGAGGQIRDGQLNGQYDFNFQLASANSVKLLFSLRDMTSMTRGGGGYSRQFSAPLKLNLAEETELTFSLGSLAEPETPGLGQDYLIKIRLDRLEPCTDNDSCFY